METFKVPQREIEARLLLEGGQEIDGKLFTPELGPDGEPGRILDRLNDPAENFLALVTNRGPLLVNTDWIVSVRLPLGEEMLDPTAQECLGVHFRLAGGSTVMGNLSFSMPPERSRLVDFLNAGPRFLKLVDDHGVLLVQCRFVVTVRRTV